MPRITQTVLDILINRLVKDVPTDFGASILQYIQKNQLALQESSEASEEEILHTVAKYNIAAILKLDGYSTFVLPQLGYSNYIVDIDFSACDMDLVSYVKESRLDSELLTDVIFLMNSGRLQLTDKQYEQIFSLLPNDSLRIIYASLSDGNTQKSKLSHLLEAKKAANEEKSINSSHHRKRKTRRVDTSSKRQDAGENERQWQQLRKLTQRSSSQMPEQKIRHIGVRKSKS